MAQNELEALILKAGELTGQVMRNLPETGSAQIFISILDHLVKNSKEDH